MMTQASPRIGLIHAVQVSMAPVAQAFSACWPQAAVMNLLDDSLAADLQRDGRVTDVMISRFERLTRYCVDQGADGVLFTCSAFGPAIENAASKVPVPVLKPNEAMFEKAFTYGKRIGMLSTFPLAVGPMEAEFNAAAAKLGSDATIETICCPEAMDAARAGDYDRHNRLLLDALPHFAGFDVLLLAQFSMAPACGVIQQRLSIPVLTSPHSAVEKLKSLLTGAV